MNSTFRLTRIVLPVVLLIAAVGAGQEIWSLDDAGLTSSEFGTIVALAQNYASLVVFEEHFGPLGRHLPDEWIEIAALPSLIEPDVDGSFVTRDAWGRPLLVRVVDNEFLFVSVGADGYGTSVEFFEGLIRQRPDDVSPSLIRASVGDDLLYAEGRLIAGPESTLSRIKQTMADMRTIGTATEAHGVDWGAYPVLPAGAVLSHELQDSLSPVYVKRMPEVDGWGNPFVVKYEARAYLIVSLGADGLPQFDYDAFELGAIEEDANSYSHPDDDIIYANGTFVSYPASVPVY
jgi:hypothetical protein